jgi:hypothetical protein
VPAILLPESGRQQFRTAVRCRCSTNVGLNPSQAARVYVCLLACHFPSAVCISQRSPASGSGQSPVAMQPMVSSASADIGHQ